MATIFEQRHGGGWLAFNCDPDEVPDWVNHTDFMEHDKGLEAAKYPIGRGYTPDEALEDMYRQVEEYNR